MRENSIIFLLLRNLFHFACIFFFFVRLCVCVCFVFIFVACNVVFFGVNTSLTIFSFGSDLLFGDSTDLIRQNGIHQPTVMVTSLTSLTRRNVRDGYPEPDPPRIHRRHFPSPNENCLAAHAIRPFLGPKLNVFHKVSAGARIAQPVQFKTG